MPDTDILAQKFATMGIIKNQTLVVAYDDSRFAFASRLWWLLRYMGHNRVVLLDGGWHDWLNRDYPIESVVPKNKSGNFEPHLNSDWVVEIDGVKSAQNKHNIVIVDYV